ncbi:D-alanyl-D-alanine carboxypeptidase [Burkholderia sp. Leaf177]|uniref:serine hydrolase domain-containing protein n=1 Tax=Burkholderia sp. Leaf177 TaxID=1736287 RepID=UPI0006F86406|nr:serine hydrolase domain-containing protein [Burkholderia sp. Leaf177]KQR81799.1 D-alanyl-D-alanine carboxypeptidase [Burkholderia sp. Leaf177]
MVIVRSGLRTRFASRGHVFAFTLILSMLLSGCGGDDSSDPAFVSAARPQVVQLMSDMQAPGAVVYVQSPKGNWLESFGVAQRGTGATIPTNANFRVGSVTKTWTATVILQLVQEGKLSLADPVSKYISNVPNGTTNTIQQLLAMRSGLYNYSRDLGFNQTLDAQPETLWTTDELLTIAYSHPEEFPPDTSFDYSNTNYILLGEIIEHITGMSAADAIKTRLFAPLGLTATYMPPEDNTAIPAPSAHGYLWGTNVETATSSALSPARQAAAKDGSLQPTDVTNASASWGWTAGSGISTIKELASVVQRMVGGGYLNPDLQSKRLSTCTSLRPSNPNAPSYCLGIVKYGTYYGHNGQISGFNTFMVYDPATATTIVIWTTTADSPDGRPPADTIGQMVIAELAKP